MKTAEIARTASHGLGGYYAILNRIRELEVSPKKEGE